MRIYIAGPMSGYELHNFPAFHAAAAHIRALGHEVISPAEHKGEQEGMAWEGWMRLDIPLVCSCDAIAVLPGWSKSRGASLEVHVGRELGLQVLDAESLLPVREHASIETLLREITEWQRVTFPNSGAHAKALHLHKEACELIPNPSDPDEIADVLILLAGIADIVGVDLREVVWDKHQKNLKRKWGEPDADGVIEHLRELVESL